MKAVLFTNYTDEDFTHTWGKEPYRFPKGSKMYLDAGIAETMAIHLVDRELNKEGLPTDHFSKRARIQKCFTEDQYIEANDETKLETEVLNANMDIKKKGGKAVKAKQEEVFEGLQDETAS